TPVPEFRNEPPADFGREENRAAMRQALAEVRERLGQKYPLSIGGEEVPTAEWSSSINPSHKAQVVGRVAVGTEDHAATAVAAARAALPDWSGLSVERRAEYL